MHAVHEPFGIARMLAHLPLEIVRRYEHWKDVVRLSGPPGLIALPGLRDRAGAPRRARVSDLGTRHRVIYRVRRRGVRVLEVGPVTEAGGRR